MNRNWKEQARGMFRPMARYLAARGVKPDHLTLAGVCLSLLAALFLGRGSFLAAGLLLPLAGLCDILDGDVAREHGIVNAFASFHAGLSSGILPEAAPGAKLHRALAPAPKKFWLQLITSGVPLT